MQCTWSSAVGPKIWWTFFSGESPKSGENRFHVNTFLATMNRAYTQIKERFLSMNSVAMTFGILFPSILLSASGDELYAAAESLANQYGLHAPADVASDRCNL